MRENNNEIRNPEDERQDENGNHGDHSKVRFYSEGMGAKSFMATMKSYLHLRKLLLERHEARGREKFVRSPGKKNKDKIQKILKM